MENPFSVIDRRLNKIESLLSEIIAKMNREVADIGKPITQLGLQQLLTIKQAQGYLKCSHVFLWKRRNEGKIQTVHAGKKILIPKASIDAYLQLDAQEKEVRNG